MNQSFPRSHQLNSQAFDEACDDFKAKHHGNFHIPAAYTECSYKALQSRHNSENLSHRLGAWDLIVCAKVFNDTSLLDAVLLHYLGKSTHSLPGESEPVSNVFSLLVKNNKQGGDLVFLYDKFLANDGVLDTKERAELTAMARKGIADLNSVLVNLDSGAA